MFEQKSLLRLLVLLCFVLLACSESGSSHAEPEAVAYSADQAELSVEERAWQKIRAGALLVDVRTPAEYAQGHLDDALNIPFDQIEERVAELGEDKDREIVVYCRSGRRSGIGEKTLRKLGFKNEFNAGGYEQLLRAK